VQRHRIFYFAPEFCRSAGPSPFLILTSLLQKKRKISIQMRNKTRMFQETKRYCFDIKEKKLTLRVHWFSKEYYF
jgi:hypothetical protein